MNPFHQNRVKLDEHLQPGDHMVLFSGTAPKSTADAHYSFLPDKNFHYLTGLVQENFAVVVHKDQEGLKSVLFIEKPDYDVEKWYGRKLKKEKAIEISGIEQVEFIEGLEGWLNKRIHENRVNRIFLDLEKLSWNEAHSKAHQFAVQLKERYLFLQLETAHPILSSLREIKGTYEIEQIKKAVEITKNGLENVMKALKPGVMEYQLEATFAHSIRMEGADGNSFPTIAASGADAVILHYVDNAKEIKDGDLVLIDLGAQYKQYAGDITRTYPANGKFTERQKQLYDIVQKAMDAVIETVKPGIPFQELNNVCKKVLTEELTAIGLIKSPEELVKYYYHGVSHHLGLDVHDLGSREAALRPGMVLTVEPGLYIAEEGIGIRIEDDILVTETGHENLSKDIIRKTEEIEAFMAKC